MTLKNWRIQKEGWGAQAGGCRGCVSRGTEAGSVRRDKAPVTKRERKETCEDLTLSLSTKGEATTIRRGFLSSEDEPVFLGSDMGNCPDSGIFYNRNPFI